MAPSTQSHGFSLVETLVATLLVASTIVALAHLVALAGQQTVDASQASASLVLAQSKLEQLRGLVWSYDAAGARVSSAGLVASPPDALWTDRAGYVEWLDRFGVELPLHAGVVPHFRRRWAIARLDPLDEDALVVRVCVFAAGTRAGGASPAPDTCVSTIRVRQP
jgi:hypothetical protein